MSDATGRPIHVRYVQERSEAADLLTTHAVDAGFLGADGYLELEGQAGISLVAVPRIAGESKDAAVLVVRASSSYESLKQINGRRVGVRNARSLSGYTYLYWLASREHVDVARSLILVRADSEEANVRALLSGQVDAVVVNRSQLALWDGADFRVISQSPESGMPPFVTGSTVDTETRAVMKRALLGMHPSDSEPHSVVDGFSEVATEDYAFARELAVFSQTLQASR